MSTPSPPRRAALLVIDMQEDFCLPHGSLGVPGGRELVPKINEMLAWPGFVLRVATRDWHPADHISFASRHEGKKPYDEIEMRNPENKGEVIVSTLWPDHCIQHTPGAALLPTLHTALLTHTISKGDHARLESYSAFGPPFRHPRPTNTHPSELETLLRSHAVTDVVCVGLAYDYCVRCTAVDSVEVGGEEGGWRVWVVRDGTAAVGQAEGDEGRVKAELEGRGVRVVESQGEELRWLKGEGRVE